MYLLRLKDNVVGKLDSFHKRKVMMLGNETDNVYLTEYNEDEWRTVTHEEGLLIDCFINNLSPVDLILDSEGVKTIGEVIGLQ